MYLFNRQANFQGPFGELMAWATDITSHVSGLLDQEVALWSAGFGAPAGSMAWAMRVDGLAGVAANTEKILGDAEYLTKQQAGQAWITAPAEDSLMQPIHGELGDQSPPVGSVATITRATISAGYADVVGWGVEMAQLVESITGSPLMFGSSMFGTFGDVVWIGVSADAAAADEANSKMLANDEYIAKVSGAGGLFVPGSGHRTFATRVH